MSSIRESKIERHHKVAKSRNGCDDEWNLEDKSEYDHAYDHAVDFVLFEQAPAFDFRLAGWNLLPEDLKKAVRGERGRRTSVHNQSELMRNVTRERNFVDNPIFKDGVKEKIYTEQRNLKISLSLSGMPKTDAHRENLSGSNNGMYGQTGELNPFYGQAHSKETRNKMSLAKKGKPWSEARRKAHEEAKSNGA